MFDIIFDLPKCDIRKEGGMVMNRSKHVFTISLILTASWLLLGCGQTETPDQAAETQDLKPSVQRSSQVTLNAVVEVVDYDARTFTLKDEGGSTQSFEVRNSAVPLENLKQGDNVTMTIYEEELAFVTEPGAELPSDEELTAVGTTEGQITVTNIKQMTSTVLAIDVENRMATLESEGIPEFTVPIQDDVTNLENVQVGDQVVTFITQVVSVTINK
jgi:Cu/Ag efflux protein CusF